MKSLRGTKFALVGAACLIVGLLALTGCSSNAGSSSAASSGSASAKAEKVVVAATPTPHAEILNEVVKPLLADEGYELEVVEFTDYVQPNTVTEQGEVDANYFQHRLYLENFNEENGTHLEEATAVHYEPFGLYAGKTASLDALSDGAIVAIPNDATNEARALLLLQQEGLIKLADDAGIAATPKDIVENPKNLQFKELEAAIVPTVLADVDIAAINGNYALEANLNPSEDALATESAEGEAAQSYANVLVVKAGNADNAGIKALVKVLNSDQVREYILNTYNGAVLPLS